MSVASGTKSGVSKEKVERSNHQRCPQVINRLTSETSLHVKDSLTANVANKIAEIPFKKRARFQIP